MYAIITDSGRQFRVEEGQRLKIDFREASEGDELQFDKVLVVGDEDQTAVGRPTVEGASVTAKVVGIEQGPKLVVQKIRRRKNSRRRTGHRQLYTTVEIDKIVTPK
ncbi:MAG: 50S ribosomal protein L21 [Planctomycetota bacterium]|nr:MAG: 50S ribosomal protein L21 [Planctomycetota bacterium]REJ94062.1 MAG: 50S ribosomal protein L21 [Planctomycetota bacterium]REK17875.1 MAG: 50S ribosomal protein L21 [Planctomycetota bacterium]REK42415.1 MAG: 50S ribosomal protein L21 [Planctomycetota bacterium]